MARIIVISGGPCSGKTTLIRRLGDEGYGTIPEAAREVILADDARRLRRDPLAFQEAVLERQLAAEAAAARGHGGPGLLFADRGVGDHFAYLRRRGLRPFPRLLAAWSEALDRYAAVVILEPSPEYRQAPYRRESAEEAVALYRCLLEEYRQRHPFVLTFPWRPIEERMRDVLEAVSGLAP